jgi:L-threonylcarbamoyladenylate synthase
MSSLREALNILRRGGVIAVPTDTVYGLVARGDRDDSVSKIYKIKGRPPEKPLVLFLSSVSQLEKIAFLDEVIRKVANTFWPGPLTLVLKAKSEAPQHLVSRKGKIGVRIPNHPLILEILQSIDFPLASTSANPSGEPPVSKREEVSNTLGSSVDLILGDRAKGEPPSTVVDVSVDPPILLRKGPISIRELEGIMGKEIVLGDELVFTVLFVCTGNTCRSPMAEAILKNLLPEEVLKRVEIFSKGTDAPLGMPVSKEVEIVLQELGIELQEHYSALLRREDVKKADLILCMENYHISVVKSMGGEAKALLLGGEDEIQDPIGLSLSIYRYVRNQIKDSLENIWIPYIVRKIKK